MDRGWKQKEEGWQKKRSESLLRQTSSNDRENRPALTGYKPLKQEEPSVRETIRLENSRGILSFGGDEKKRMTLVTSEKRSSEGPGTGRRERSLEEKGRRDRPLGGNKTVANPGDRSEGAFGFQFRPSATRTQMMEQIKGYMDRHPQKTLKQMMPFMATKKELREKNRLEEEISRNRRENGGRNPQQLDGLLQDKKQELIRKKQMEVRFGQRLEQAAAEEKKTVWSFRNSPAVKIRGQIQAAPEDQENQGDQENQENQENQEDNCFVYRNVEKRQI